MIPMSRTPSAEMSMLLTLKALMILASVIGSNSALTWESHDWTSDPWSGWAETGTVDDDDDDGCGIAMSSMPVLPECGTSVGNGNKSGTVCIGGSFA